MGQDDCPQSDRPNAADESTCTKFGAAPGWRLHHQHLIYGGAARIQAQCGLLGFQVGPDWMEQKLLRGMCSSRF